jgi:hypothetical protein
MIKQNKLSLTKKLDGGYLHVKKSPIKSSVKSTKDAYNKGGYSDYLNKNKTTGSTNNSSSQSGGKDNSKKVVSVKLMSPKKRVSPRKVKRVKDIPDIIPSNPIKPVEPKQAPKQAPKPLRKQNIPLQNVKVKGSLKKQLVLKRQSSKGKRINKSLTKRRQHSLKRGKRISVTKTRKYSNKDINMIQNKLKEIKDKSNNQIKDELEKQGIKLSGKAPSLMKDIYMYSQLCGINIKRE